MKVNFFSQSFMIHDGAIDEWTRSDFPCITFKPDILDSNTWIDVSFVHSLTIIKKRIGLPTIKAIT